MADTPTGRARLNWIWISAIVVLLALRAVAIARPAGGDQGLYTYNAQRMVAGDVPYRDAWDQKPPGVFFVYAAVDAVVPRQAVVGVADLCSTVITVWLLISLGRRWLGGRTGELAAVIFLVLADPGIQRLGGLNVRAQCETFIGAAIAGAILLAGNPARRRSGWIAAGVLLAAAFWLKYNALAYAAPVLAAAALAEPRATPLAGRLTSVRWIAAGFAMPALAVVLWFVASGAFADLWLATIRYNMAYSGETYGGVFDFVRYVFTFPVAHARVDGLWFVGLLGALVIVASAVRRNLRESLVPILWLAAAIAAIAINGSRSLPQYFVQAWPALALLAAGGLCLAWRDRQLSVGRIQMAIVAVVLAAGVWRVGVEPGPAWQPRSFGTPQAFHNLMHDVRWLNGAMSRTEYLARFDRGESGKYSPASVERLAARAIDVASPDETIFVFGFAGGGVLSHAERRSASRFFWSRPVVLEFARERPGYGSAGLLADLTRARPALVALQKQDWGLGETTTPNSQAFFMNHSSLRGWLEAGYEPDYEDEAFAVWRRKS